MTAQTEWIDLADWPVAILAGGLAKRLRPATDKTPESAAEPRRRTVPDPSIAAPAFSRPSQDSALCRLSR